MASRAIRPANASRRRCASSSARTAQLTDEREEPIAADAREQGDGKEIAKRRWWRLSSASGSTRSCDGRNGRASGATGSGRRLPGCFCCSRSRRPAAPSMPGSSSRPTRRSSTLPSNARPRSSTKPWRKPKDTTCRAARRWRCSPSAEGLFDDMARYGRPTPELRYRKAWMLIQFARNYAILGEHRQAVRTRKRGVSVAGRACLGEAGRRHLCSVISRSLIKKSATCCRRRASWPRR